MSEQNDISDHNEDMRGPKRKRLAQACDVCRRKKIKCDGVKPMCGNCKRTGRECTYNPNVKKRGPRQGYMEMLEKRLDKMEKMLTRGHELSQQQQQQQQQQQHSSSADSTLSEDASNTRSPQPPNNNPIISQQHHCSSSSTATANNSVINEPTSATTVASFSPANNVNNTFPTNQQQQQQQSTSVLPSTDIVLHLIHLFFEYIYNYTPIFDKETLIRDVQEQRCPEFLILAIMAVSARYSDRSDIAEDPPWHSGEKYACKARDMHFTFWDCTNTVVREVRGAGCYQGWLFGRMALEIGLNREPGLAYKDRPLSTAQWMQHEVQRQLFWSIFAVDRFLSASTGRPPILQEEDCEILLPCDEDGWCTRKFYTESINKEHYVLFTVCPMQGSNLLGITTTISSEPLVDGNGNRLQLSCMANVYRGAALLGRLTVFINRKCRQRKLFTPDGPGSDFAQLDQAIDEWYSNFPAELQYTQANMACHRQRSMPYFCRFLLLHTLHNTMIVLLHRPALAQMDSSNADNVQPHLRECYAASAAKCMGAVARVTDLIGSIKENKVLISPFLTYLTYTVATIVVNNIFFGKGDDVYKSKKALTEHFSLLQISYIL
ncbi:zinc finger transcription factor 1 [Lichtheimia corymbifera JMRC:FSU:9682]|uniref:Zinc finger transcription factor 1 n=1 Tax=Lichtheimia corymbifera JMRC:FSU:9682 TaxID=1263082 RepID=A0A068S484_9FUNG|nr:zinc finger transcription factor 1 [Lichtheimia corymbifera JMRC:FSU:9682]